MAVFERDMNQIYLTYSLPRMDYFRKVMVNAAKDVSVPVFYGISAFVLVLLLSVISVSDLLKREPAVMRQKLSLMGIGPFTTAGSRILGVSVLLSVISVLAAAAAAWTGMISIGLNTILTGFLVCLGAASFSVCLFQTQEVGSAAFSAVFSGDGISFSFGRLSAGSVLPEAYKELLHFFLPIS